MELKQAFFILRHGSSEGLPEYLKAIKTIEDNCLPRHGRWVDKMVRDWHCSECGKKARFDGYCYDDKPNYCPNCGAKMDGDGYDRS